MIKTGWWFIVVTMLISWAAALGVSYIAQPMYQARATFIVSPNPNLTSSRDVISSLDTLDSESIISTYADILSSNRVLEDAIRKLNLEAEDVKGYVNRVNVQPNSNILELLVEGPDPTMSALLANNVGQNAINYIKGIYQIFDIAFLDQAQEPVKPFSPVPLRDGGIAAGIGLVAGIVLVVVVETIRIPLETLRERAVTDRVSQAYTERHFRRCIEQEMARNKEDPISLGLIDLEGLHDLVEVLPEQVLSRLMQKVTNILRKQLYGTDIVGRWGKTGYAVLLLSTPGTAAMRTLERIRLVLSEPLSFDPTWDAVELYPSVGIATRLTEDETASVLIQHAEAALERAAGGGGGADNKTVIYSEEGEEGGS
jgi:diguanylate cyclase (GGDEF)-like protein